MTIEHRIEKLEERVVISPGEPSFLLYVAARSEPTKEAIECAKKKVTEKAKKATLGGGSDDPVYILYFDKDGIWRE